MENNENDKQLPLANFIASNKFVQQNDPMDPGDQNSPMNSSNQFPKVVNDLIYSRQQKDGLISELQRKLEQCIQDGDCDAEQKLLEFTQEVNSLMHLLKDGLKIRKPNAENSENQVPLDSMLESGVIGSAEHKYHMLLQVHKESKTKHLFEIADRDETIRRLQEDLDNSKSVQSIVGESQVQEMETIIENLKGTIVRLETERREDTIQWECKLSEALRTQKEEYDSKIESLIQKHQSNMKEIEKQIDIFEHNQKENGSKMSQMYNECLKYKTLLDTEQLKNQKLIKEIENTKAKFSDTLSKYFTLKEYSHKSDGKSRSNAIETECPQTLNKVSSEHINTSNIPNSSIENVCSISNEANFDSRNESTFFDESVNTRPTYPGFDELLSKVHCELANSIQKSTHIDLLNQECDLLKAEKDQANLKVQECMSELVDKKSELLDTLHQNSVLEDKINVTENTLKVCNKDNLILMDFVSYIQEKMKPNPIVDVCKSGYLSSEDLEDLKNKIEDLKLCKSNLENFVLSFQNKLTCSFIDIQNPDTTNYTQVLPRLEAKILEELKNAKESEKLSFNRDEVAQNVDRLNDGPSGSSLSTEGFSNDIEHLGTNSNDKISSSSQTSEVLTCEQGFQTINQNNTGIVSTRTIQEDYILEEIFIAPKSNLPIPFTKVANRVNPKVNSPCHNCEELKHKYYDSQFVIRSLENENLMLKRSKFRPYSSCDIPRGEQVGPGHKVCNERIKLAASLPSLYKERNLKNEKYFSENINSVPSSPIRKSIIATQDESVQEDNIRRGSRPPSRFRTSSTSDEDLMNELEELTSSIVFKSHKEKVELLQSQQEMMIRILERNQLKISEICQKHIDELKETSAQDLGVSDLERSLSEVMQAIDVSLAEELCWLESEYGELLRQYSHEQSLISQTHSMTLQEIRTRVCALLKPTDVQESEVGSQHVEERYQSVFGSPDSLSLGRYVHHDEMNGNTDTWKRLLAVMSQVAMNLLHYYITSQRYARNEEDPNPMDQYEEDISLRDLDAEPTSLQNETSLNVLDTTAASEGMLDDLERNEQLKELLSASYPHLVKAFKRNYDKISLQDLEGEVQELVISLQAATGMLKVFMMSKIGQSREVSCSPLRPTVTESGLGSGDSHSQSSVMESVDSESAISHSEQTIASDYTTLQRLSNCQNDSKNNETECNENSDELKKQLHQTRGLYRGLLSEKDALLKVVEEREEALTKLQQQFKEAKESLEEAERHMKKLVPSPNRPNKQGLDIKEKVKAVLVSKDKETMGHAELIQRTRDLESVLLEAVEEKDLRVEELNAKVVDLSHQLEVADRQLRSSRQFLEEQAAERDAEVEELVNTVSDLRSVLKDKENLTTNYSELQKELHTLENELREKQKQMEESIQKNDSSQDEIKAARKKINELRECVQQLESQLVTRCLESEQWQDQLLKMNDEMVKIKEENIHYQDQLDALTNDRHAAFSNATHPSEDQTYGAYSPGRPKTSVTEASLLEEMAGRDTSQNLEDMMDGTSIMDYSMIDSFITRLEKSALGLESLQFSMMSASPIPDMEANLCDQPEWLEPPTPKEQSRVLSPSSLEAKLDDKFIAFEKSVEMAVKYTRDLEMRLKNMKKEHEDVIAERDELCNRVATLASVKSELESAALETRALWEELNNNKDKLQEELLQAQTKEKELIESLQLVEDREKLHKSERDSIEVEKTKVEKKYIQEVKESDAIRKQNNALLIKISGLEARLDEMRRSNSPPEAEFQARISLLQGELQKAKDELTAKHREVNDLQYTVKEMKERVLLREDQLSRLQNAKQPEDTSRSEIEDALCKIENLEKELKKERRSKQEFEEKIEKTKTLDNKSTPSSLSDALVEALLEEKKELLTQSSNRIQTLESDIQSILDAVRNGLDIVEVAALLEKCVQNRPLWTEKIRVMVDACPEVQRKEPETSQGLVTDYIRFDGPFNRISEDTVVNTFSSDVSDERRLEASLEYPSMSQKAVEKTLDESRGSSSSEVNRFDVSTESEFILKEQVLILEKEVKDLLDYQKRLEADYNALQDLLESKDEEIKTLSEEANDNVGVISAPQLDFGEYERQISEFKSKADHFSSLHKEVESKFEAAEAEIKSSHVRQQSVERKLRKALKEVEKVEEARRTLEQEMVESQNRAAVMASEFADQRRLNELQRNELESELDSHRRQISDLRLEAAKMDRKHQETMKSTENEHMGQINILTEEQRNYEIKLREEYEERVKTQVNELASKLSKEKEAALEAAEMRQRDAIVSLEAALKNGRAALRSGKDTSSKRTSATPVEKRSCGTQFEFLPLTPSTSMGSCSSSRENSVHSCEGDSMASRGAVDELIKKVYKDGLQVLSLSEFAFLQSQSSVIPLAMSAVADDTSTEGLQSWKSRVQYLESEASFERKRCEGFVRLLEEAKTETSKAEDLLKREKIEVDSLKTTLQEIKFNASKEIEELRMRLLTRETQIHALEVDLESERKNFDRVSSTLIHQRNLNDSQTKVHEKIIENLKSCLERERKRVLALSSDRLLHSSPMRSAEKSTMTKPDPDLQAVARKDTREVRLEAEVQQLRDLVNALASEREEKKDVEKTMEIERVRVVELKEALRKKEEELKLNTSKLDSKNSRLLVLESMVKELRMRPNDPLSSYSDPRNDPRATQKDHRLPSLPDLNTDFAKWALETNGGVSLYASLLKCLREKDIELSNVKRKLSEAQNGVPSRVEDRILEFLEKQTRTKNPIESLGVLHAQNVELWKIVISLNDEKQDLSMKVLNLEDELSRLNHKFKLESGSNSREATKPRKESSGNGNAGCQRYGIDERAKLENNRTENSLLTHLQWKYNRSESYRWALVFQKQYLSHQLRRYQSAEKKAVNKLIGLASKHMASSDLVVGPKQLTLSPRAKFRTGVFAVLAVIKMTRIMDRWNLRKRRPLLQSLQTLTRNHNSHIPTTSNATNEHRMNENSPSAYLQMTPSQNLSQPSTSAITGMTPPTKERKVPPLRNFGHTKVLFGSEIDERVLDLNEHWIYSDQSKIFMSPPEMSYNPSKFPMSYGLQNYIPHSQNSVPKIPDSLPGIHLSTYSKNKNLS